MKRTRGRGVDRRGGWNDEGGAVAERMRVREARESDCFPRVDRKRKGDGDRRVEERAIPVQLSLADRCICQNVADVSGSFHVVTTCCYYRTFLFSAAPRRLLAASIRNAATRCNPLCSPINATFSRGCDRGMPIARSYRHARFRRTFAD